MSIHVNDIPSPYSPLQSKAELELDEKKKAVNDIINTCLAYGYYEDENLKKKVDSAESKDTLKTIVDGHISHYTEKVKKLDEIKSDLSSSGMESKLRNQKIREQLDSEIGYINRIILPNLKAVFPKNNGGRKKSSRKKRKRHKSKKISSKSKIKKGGDCVRSST